MSVNKSTNKINLPAIARGEIIPPKIEKLIRDKEEAEKRAKRAERKNLFYFIGGLVGTTIGTVVGWLLGKFC